MKFLKAVARVLAAMTVMVIEWSEELGRFILRCRPGYQPPLPDDVVDAYAEAVETAPVAPAADRRLENIQSIAAGLFRQQEPNPALADGLSSHTMTWLTALGPDMLLMVAKSRVEDLQAHIKGIKTIRGLLAYDPESVQAYVATAAKEAEPEIERIRRRPRREPLFPPFGPMCSVVREPDN